MNLTIHNREALVWFQKEFWNKIKTYSLTIKSINMARLMLGTSIDVNREFLEAKLSTEGFLEDEVDTTDILRIFNPYNAIFTTGDMFVNLSPKYEFNLYNKTTMNYAIDLIALFEELLQKFLLNYYHSDPSSLLVKERTITTDLLKGHNSIDSIVASIVDEKVMKVMYSRVTHIVKHIKGLYKVKIQIEDSDLDNIIELKEIRNIALHNSGVVNDVFLKRLPKGRLATSEFELDKEIVVTLDQFVIYAKSIKRIVSILYEVINKEMIPKLVNEERQEVTNDIIQSYSKSQLHSKGGGSRVFKQMFQKLGRNDPCLCGSGLKYKKCCLPIYSTIK